jgi:hypothetical protein
MLPTRYIEEEGEMFQTGRKQQSHDRMAASQPYWQRLSNFGLPPSSSVVNLNRQVRKEIQLQVNG